MKKLIISLEDLHKGNIKVLCKITYTSEEFNLMCKLQSVEMNRRKIIKGTKMS